LKAVRLGLFVACVSVLQHVRQPLWPELKVFYSNMSAAVVGVVCAHTDRVVVWGCVGMRALGYDSTLIFAWRLSIADQPLQHWLSTCG